MSINLINTIMEKIKEYDKIAIFRHVFPDPDSYGSQVGLKSIIENTYKNKKVILLGEHSENLSYIGEMDNEEKLDKDTLAIILDVSNKERVDNQSFNDCGFVIKIDHHKPFDAPFEQITWVDTNYPSCSEMILDLYLANKEELTIDEKGRKALFAGIIGDTGRFLYVSDPTELFAKLANITHGIDTKSVYSNMYKRKEIELKFMGYIYSNYEKLDSGVAYLKVPYSDLGQFEIEPMKAARMVNALQDTEGIINWHFFVEKADGNILCEFRSSGPVVNDIAAKYGGGGHMLAAGATVAGFDVVDKIIKDFDMNCKHF